MLNLRSVSALGNLLKGGVPTVGPRRSLNPTSFDPMIGICNERSKPHSLNFKK